MSVGISGAVRPGGWFSLPMVAASDICDRDNTVSDSGWSTATLLLNSPFSDTRFMLSYAWRKNILTLPQSQAHVGVQLLLCVGVHHKLLPQGRTGGHWHDSTPGDLQGDKGY